MAIIPLIIDSRPSYLRGNGAPRSLLLTPMGTQTLLGYVCNHVQAVTDEVTTLVTMFAADREYEASVRRAAPALREVVSIEQLDEVLERLEPSDWLLAVDPRYFPADRADLREPLSGLAELRGARHLVAMETNHQGTKEYVQLDGKRRVRRIQRLYAGVTWLQASAVFASLFPASVARQVSNGAFRDLAALRTALVDAGVVGGDITLPGGVFDLNQKRGLLQLCEHCLGELTSRNAPLEYSTPAPGVWVAPRCCIDPTARLYGPVVLHEGVQLEANTTLIGPAVVGAGSRVCRDSVLVRCVLTPEVVVPARTTAQYDVLCGADSRGPACPAGSTWESLAKRWPQRLRVVVPERSAGPGMDGRRRETYIAVKRVVESVIAVLGLIVLSPLLLVIAVAIKLQSPGPVFFCHEREGKNGKPFRCRKFRTMMAGAHRQQRALHERNLLDGPQFKLRDDPRITSIGHWVRGTNIDEMPQLINVVLGQMSLIGPRPSPFRENQICVPWRKARLVVRPGITGLWQLCRRGRSAGDFHQWISYDMLYVHHVSAWLDLKILLATLVTMGGRWTMPLTWLISARKLREDYERPPIGRRRPAVL